jgi:AraC family transcriptional regulator, transcriptional activator of pobA
MQKLKTDNIPILNPAQFDDYLFSNWQSPLERTFDKFHIERIENYKNNLKLPLQPHRRSVYFFVFLTKGSAVRTKGLNRYEINCNEFFFLSANQITNIEYISDDAEGFYCHFANDIFNTSNLKIELENDFHFFQLISEPILQVTNNERVIAVLEILFEEYLTNKSERFVLIPIYLLALLSELKSITKPRELTAKNAATQITQRYKNALSVFIYEKKSVAEYAEYLNLSANHLHKCVKATTGKSAHELLEEMRILEAKVLLKQTNLSIGEIAYRIGRFESSDFGRFFKKYINLTPNQYRNS